MITTGCYCRKSPEASSKKKGKSARIWANEGKNAAELDFSAAGDNEGVQNGNAEDTKSCLLYTSPSPRDSGISRMPSSA